MDKHKLIHKAYLSLFKPIAFAVDAEIVHNSITSFGELLENYPWLVESIFPYKNRRLEKKVLGLHFANPIGLAAGFDYDGHLAKVVKDVGFGFNTVGTVTALPYEGNVRPRLMRLPKSKSLLVNKGFKSAGAKEVAKRLDSKNLKNHLLGISVGSSNLPQINSIKKAVDDYLFTFKVFKNKSYVKYFELNISCPNTSITQKFTDPKNFIKLVTAVKKLKIKKPIFIKMPNEISPKDSDQLVGIALKNNIYGFIFSNLVKDRANPSLVKSEVNKLKNLKGNFSGKPTFKNSINLISHTRKKFGRQVVIIGTGGIFTAQDAKAKLAAGADLVQLITGMIYEGPQLIGEICKELAK